MRTKDRDIASALVFSQDGKLLMGQKPPARATVYPDGWHIPGGGLEEGETQEAAVVREVLEETGLDIAAYPLELIDSEGSGEATKQDSDGQPVLVRMRFFIFKVTIADRLAADMPLTGADDLINLRWFSTDELTTIELTPPSVLLFKRLGYL